MVAEIVGRSTISGAMSDDRDRPCFAPSCLLAVDWSCADLVTITGIGFACAGSVDLKVDVNPRSRLLVIDRMRNWATLIEDIESMRDIQMQRTYKARVEIRGGTFENITVQAKDMMSARKLMEAQYRGMKVFSVEEVR